MQKLMRVFMGGAALLVVSLVALEAQAREVVGPLPPGWNPGRGGVYVPPPNQGAVPPPRYDNRPGRGRPPGRGPGRGGYQCGVITRSLQRPMINGVVALRQELGLNRQFDGCIVERVDLVVRHAGPHARAQLVVNQFVEDWRDVDWQVTSLFVRGLKRLDREVNSLQLHIQGRVFVDRVTVYLGQRW